MKDNKQYSQFKQYRKALKAFLTFKTYRERKIVERQKHILNEYQGDLSRVIIFLTSGNDKVNGGVMSIISLADETEKLHHVHNSAVFVCSAPGQPPLLRFTRFKNSRVLVDFRSLLSRLKPGKQVLIHIPELYVSSYVAFSSELSQYIKNLDIDYNIMLQNIDLIPTLDDVNLLKQMGSVSITTAHKAYSNKLTENALGCPLWLFSVWVSPEKYERRKFADKKNIIIVSPDSHPNKELLLKALKNALSEYEFITIKRMSYENYKSLIASAKFALTFGEGLDGYFVETVFSGGIGCAVYNNRFFTENYANLPCIFNSWEQLVTELPKEIKKLAIKSDYYDYHNLQFTQLAADYSFEQYIANLERFYKERFTCNS